MWLWSWVMTRSWKSFQAHDRKDLHCLEEIVGRNMDVKGDSGKRTWKEGKRIVEQCSFVLENTYIVMKRILLEILNIQYTPDEVSDKYEENIIGIWRKGDTCCKVSRNFAESCSTVEWKIELVSDELGFLDKELSKQSMKDVFWFFLVDYSKM